MRLEQMSLVISILNEIANQDPDCKPLPRQLNAVIDAANSIADEFARDEIMSSSGIGIAAWRKTDQVGSSSDFMAAQIGGNAGIRDYAHPHDPSDFGRCLSLLDAAPELRKRLLEMAKESVQWAALVENWSELERLYQEESPSGQAPKLYKMMRGLLHLNPAL